MVQLSGHTVEFWIISGVAGILLPLCIFLLKEIYHERRKKESSLTSAIERLENTMNKLDRTMSFQNASCIEKHTSINARLKNIDVKVIELDKRVDDNSSDIKVIKSYIKLK